jgi:aminopeptidase N
MFLKVAGFEFRFQVKNPVFWVAVAMFFLLTFGATTSPQVQIGSGGNIHKNAPSAILQTQLIFSLFFMFVATAFVANVVVRDDETGFGPIVRSTRITKFHYLIGRFVGATAAAAIAFMAVPAAILVGSLMPWLDPETLGPNRISDYLFSYLAFSLPNVILISALFFMAATVTRSMMWTYVAVVVVFLAWLVLTTLAEQKPELRSIVALVEPFGLGAVGEATRYWTAAEQNRMMPALEGLVLLNRLIWVGMAMLFLGIAYRLFSFSERGISKRKERKQRQLEAAADEAPVIITERLPAPASPREAASAQLWARTQLEMKQVFRSPAFFILLALGMVNSIANLWFAGEIFGTPTIPVTAQIIPILMGSFGLFPIIIAIYYGGELVWRERDRRMHEIIDATPLPNWVYVVPKMAAVALVLLATVVVSVFAGMIVQLLRGYTNFELGKYLLWYVVPVGFRVIMLAVLAVFVQSLSPNKYVGWGIMLLYMVSSIVLGALGYEHNLYRYARTPGEPTSDFNQATFFWPGVWWLRLYWFAFAILLLVTAHLLWRRGAETRLMPRIRRVPSRLRGSPGLIALGALLVFAGTGAWVYYNSNILNRYRTSVGDEEYIADFEKKYLKYERLPHPTVSAVRLDVDLHPRETKALVKGSYVVTNLTDQPIREIHLRNDERELKVINLSVEGGRLRSEDKAFGYRIYALDRPMMPAEKRLVTFATQRWERGFRNNGNSTRLVHNGTFLNNFELAPLVGMDRSNLLQERAKRRKYGLAPELRPAKLEDLSGTRRSFAGVGWATADITLTTDADQLPIAPGKKVSDVTRNGRRTAHFVSDAPILTFFSIQSARYVERRRRHAGVDLTVYYHPTHGWNVDRMLNALEKSLDYYQANFGPYQFDQARIIEFPAYSRFAQAFANTMPYSESIGFAADTSDPEKIDAVTYVTAHELGHQYWPHQIVPAEMQGGTMLVETLAQYSALMVMKQLYGEDKIRRFLKLELDRYLRSRGGEAVEELPLERVENQQYIHYNKGSLAMYLLQERLGEDAVNRALRRYLARYRFKGAPFPRSIELVNEFRREAKSPEDQALITDLFQRITVYDLKVRNPTAVKRADGRWDVTVPVEAKKFYAGGKGEEKETRLSDRIQLGLFTAEPGRGTFDRRNVILMRPQPVRSGNQLFRFITDKKPTHVGADPYNFYIDRNSDDNVAAVT